VDGWCWLPRRSAITFTDAGTIPRNRRTLKQLYNDIHLTGVFSREPVVPVLLSILGALAAAAFWYYRIQADSRLTDETVRAIEDPAVAAAALLIALASRRGPVGPAA
jgi:hypothetical protein